MTRSVPAGAAAGAILFALVYVLAMHSLGLPGRWTVGGFIIGLVYGAIIAAVISRSVMQSIKWDKV